MIKVRLKKRNIRVSMAVHFSL